MGERAVGEEAEPVAFEREIETQHAGRVAASTRAVNGKCIKGYASQSDSD